MKLDRSYWNGQFHRMCVAQMLSDGPAMESACPQSLGAMPVVVLDGSAEFINANGFGACRWPHDARHIEAALRQAARAVPEKGTP